MNKSKILSMVFLAGIFLSLQSAVAQASDKNKRQIYDKNRAEVTNRGLKLSFISKEEIALKNQGKELRFIESGRVYDENGNSHGKAKKGGTYFPAKGQFVLSEIRHEKNFKPLRDKGHFKNYLHRNQKLRGKRVQRLS